MNALLAGCAGVNSAMTIGTSKVAPPDYRQRIAAVLRTDVDLTGLQSARISKPLDRFKAWPMAAHGLPSASSW